MLKRLVIFYESNVLKILNKMLENAEKPMLTHKTDQNDLAPVA